MNNKMKLDKTVKQIKTHLIKLFIIGGVAFDIAYLLPRGHPMQMILGGSGAILIGTTCILLLILTLRTRPAHHINRARATTYPEKKSLEEVPREGKSAYK